MSFAKLRDTLECGRSRNLHRRRKFRHVGHCRFSTFVLVEDHQALREGLELLLGRDGIEVLGTAGSATEGRELIERLDPDSR